MKASSLWMNCAAACAVELQSVCEGCGELDCETKPTFIIGKETYLRRIRIIVIVLGSQRKIWGAPTEPQYTTGN